MEETTRNVSQKANNSYFITLLEKNLGVENAKANIKIKRSHKVQKRKTTKRDLFLSNSIVFEIERG